MIDISFKWSRLEFFARASLSCLPVKKKKNNKKINTTERTWKTMWEWEGSSLPRRRSR
ncbi:hypothetical protein PUN28_003411 [Cardiocondyla obscurior]|uniref:Uncharacterized protein n=1 Tax=Cardiocondyla obscurior TaxID=286306 RepID=A0AAW2GML6_9HYME